MFILMEWFLLSKTKLYVQVRARANQKLSKVLTKGFERSVYWNKCKKKRENENMTNEFRYFLKSNFVGVECQEYYLPKGIIKRYDVIINGKKNYGEAINSDNRTRWRLDTNGCLLDYEYIKNHYIDQ